MAEGLNRVMLLGNLGADPELRYTQGGQAVLNLRLATTESYLDRDRVRKDRTDWHNIVVWGKRGEGLSKILSKGSSIFVEGSLRTSSFEGRDGVKRYKTEVNARNVLLTGGGRGRGGGGGYDDRDAGPPMDAGPPVDAGPPMDAGPGHDQGPPANANVSGNAGAGFDDDDDIPF